MKKAQDLGINTIILAAIGVLVLIILIAVFAGNMGKQNKNIGSATNGAESVTNIIGSSGNTLSGVKTLVKGSKTAADCSDKLVSAGLSMLICSPTSLGPCWNTTEKFTGKSLKKYYIYICRNGKQS